MIGEKFVGLKCKNEEAESGIIAKFDKQRNLYEIAHVFAS
jgi:hypothetical protein